ncbi:MAG: YqaA family protein [Candidatus Aphodosoma sp.]
MDYLVDLGYIGLMIAAFLAATIVPFSSEAVFTALFWGGLNPWWLIFWATIGNTLGGMTCFWLGHIGKIEWIERWLKIKKEKIDSFESKFHRYGDWVAFFSFLPGVGDVIAVAAGFMRCRWWIVLISMALGKLARYIVWMYFNGLFIN